jgi:hypothetical protein
MKEKNHKDLEDIYSKILNEAKDLEYHNHSYNEPTKGDDHTPYPDTSDSLESTLEDEEEDNVKNTQEFEFEDLNDRDDDDDYLGDEEEDSFSLERSSYNLLDKALDVINEAKKKAVSPKKNANPWAIENAIEKKTGHKFSKKKKEKIVKEIKKSAKHAGKKITSKPIKKK